MALDIYLADTEVTLTIDLIDAAGNELSVNSVQYSVLDMNGEALVPQASLATFTSGDSQAVVVITDSINALTSPNTREIRTVELRCETDTGTIGISKTYAIETTDPLAIPDTSFQTFPMAQLTALDIPNIAAFNAASESEQIAALMDAREHIVQLNFNMLNSNVNFGQDSLHYVPEGSFQSAYVARNSLFLFNGNLNLLNETQFNQLPEKFKRALRQAQVVEANAILGGEPDDAKRSLGIVEEKIGESTIKFGQGAKLSLPVCKRALGYLSYYVSFAKRIGRG
jgi:hypothetical protein